MNDFFDFLLGEVEEMAVTIEKILFYLRLLLFFHVVN